MKQGHIYTLTLVTCCVMTFGAVVAHAQDARHIHREALDVDAHNDVLYQSVMRGKDIGVRINSGHTDLPRIREGGIDVQVFAVWCDETYGKGKAFSYANKQIDRLMELIQRQSGDIGLATNPEAIRQINAQGKIAAVIGVEGGHMIENRIEYLDSLYRRGARYLTLTWNNSLEWASSATDEARNPGRLKQKGLNEFG